MIDTAKNFLTGNWADIMAVAGALHVLALAIVNLTPTPWDNNLYGKFYKVIEVVAGVVSNTVKELPGERDVTITEDGDR